MTPIPDPHNTAFIFGLVARLAGASPISACSNRYPQKRQETALALTVSPQSGQVLTGIPRMVTQEVFHGGRSPWLTEIPRMRIAIRRA